MILSLQALWNKNIYSWVEGSKSRTFTEFRPSMVLVAVALIEHSPTVNMCIMVFFFFKDFCVGNACKSGELFQLKQPEWLKEKHLQIEA